MFSLFKKKEVESPKPKTKVKRAVLSFYVKLTDILDNTYVSEAANMIFDGLPAGKYASSSELAKHIKVSKLIGIPDRESAIYLDSSKIVKINISITKIGEEEVYE